MAYCTLNDIKEHIAEASIAQLTDDASGTVISQPKVDEAIRDADELIDGYLRGRYELPMTEPVPGLINTISENISIYNLYCRRPGPVEIPQAVEERYRDAMKFLEQIQKGIISLGTATGVTPEPGSFKTNKTDEDRIFTKDVLDLY